MVIVAVLVGERTRHKIQYIGGILAYINDSAFVKTCRIFVYFI